MFRIRALIVASTCLLPVAGRTSAHAQEATRLIAGDRVRVRSWMAEREEGVVQSATKDSLSFVARQGTYTLARADVRQLDVARGIESRAHDFAIAGLVGGVVIGALAGATAQGTAETSVNKSATTMVGGLVVGLAGSSIGHLIGRRFTETHWQTVIVNGVGVGVGP